MVDQALQTIVEAVREASQAQRPLRILGGGTKDFLGGEPQGEPLDVKPLRGISAYEPSELVVTVRAGTPLAELEAALAEKGQCLPFEPPRLGAVLGLPPLGVVAAASANGAFPGTVGGMVASGLAGPARSAVGGVRDYLLGATLVNGRAQVLSFGGQVMKNVAGYDVSRALAGSMGQLGVIAEVSLKVLPVAPARQTLRFDLDQATALRRVNEWAGQPLPLSASAWWDGALIVRLQGARAAVASATQRLGGELIPEHLADGFWNGLRDQRDEYFDQARQAVASGARLWRLSVAPAAPRLELGGPLLIEWGGGQRWLVTDAAAQRVRDVAAEANGHAMVWLGDKSCGACAPVPAAERRLQMALKAAFDPHRLFNPGRLDNLC
ncbi:glycolate oxidase subunit GlcE [Ideonella sp. DXS29W]|uniref:Glycolate oxidase subunit GlcE n=1 Tax=Ideonella lacteola TaxID=2984193 RepID=A0ABU9BWL8_9BURK